ncbi:SigE family RNA polymerase sigma factor [Streptomyces canus]|uniref:SigE family RNA polymerase sigma factor n=1 Tax=Streptomyces canus TaxID=58343 RepID=UPI002250AE4C|nr:SigE family RNA polymerase sigma factor [Streptomyces canus]MCX4857343.1 SigE family RNA polymerase sigma factor [Streptomyces canus]WSW37300.1 SigE family RNA polymerase sigma factor [Streptomyces canus]
MRQARADEYAEFAAARAGHLYRSACLLTAGDTHLAEDLVQEALGRIYLRWSRISLVGNPAAYAQTVLVRVFLTHQRRRSSRERATDVLPEVAAAGVDTPLRLTLLDALARLPAKDRAVVVLRYWEDRSIEETAGVLNSSAAAVRTRCTRALKQLRGLLGEDIGAYARP